MNAMKKLRYWMAVPVCFFAVQVLAGTIQSVKVVPATAPTGQQVKVTVEGEDEAICGLSMATAMWMSPRCIRAGTIFRAAL